MTTGKYVHYGCGWCAPRSWINYDASPTLRFERLPLVGLLYTKNQARFPKNVLYGDIVKGLPVQNNTCWAVYCSHVLEHLSLLEFRQALINTYKILEPGGTFRFVLPDLEYYIRSYREDQSHDAALTFMKCTLLGTESRRRGLKSFAAEYLGHSRHLWMWDYKSVANELGQAGFAGIRQAAFGDAVDRRFDDVEEAARWEHCLGVECIK